MTGSFTRHGHRGQPNRRRTTSRPALDDLRTKDAAGVGRVITTGTHRQMLNHEVWIGDERWTMAYKRSYASLYCLINFACERPNMTRYCGSYSSYVITRSPTLALRPSSHATQAAEPAMS